MFSRGDACLGSFLQPNPSLLHMDVRAVCRCPSTSLNCLNKQTWCFSPRLHRWGEKVTVPLYVQWSHWWFAPWSIQLNNISWDWSNVTNIQSFCSNYEIVWLACCRPLARKLHKGWIFDWGLLRTLLWQIPNFCEVPWFHMDLFKLFFNVHWNVVNNV